MLMLALSFGWHDHLIENLTTLPPPTMLVVWRHHNVLQPPGAGHEDDEATPSSASSSCYAHPMLQRERRDLAKEMRRRPAAKRGQTPASVSSLPYTTKTTTSALSFDGPLLEIRNPSCSVCGPIAELPAPSQGQGTQCHGFYQYSESPNKIQHQMKPSSESTEMKKMAAAQPPPPPPAEQAVDEWVVKFLMDDISITMMEDKEGQLDHSPHVEVGPHDHGGRTSPFLLAPVFRPISRDGIRAERADNTTFAAGICLSSARPQPFCGGNAAAVVLNNTAAITSHADDLLVRAGSLPQNSDVSAQEIQQEIINTFCREGRPG
jgi:hypothetical protein